MKEPSDIRSLKEAIEYWQQCLDLLDKDVDECVAASRMVGIVSSEYAIVWSEGVDAHPAYQLIFELAASLELPEKFTGQRAERWQCIRALLPVLKRVVSK